MSAESFANLPVYGRNVREFGAQGDGQHDDSAAIQAALDAGSPLVVIPYGRYKIGRSLCLPSHIELQVHPQAHLFLADGAGVDRNSFLLTNQNHDSGNSDIRVSGGIWDGNNPHNTRGPDAPNSYTGVLINFVNVQGLHLQSMTVRDAESYFIRLGEVQDFVVEHIQFEAPHLRPNQDGVHLGGFCEDGVIRHLRGIGLGTTNDDMVALNADDANDRAQNLGKKRGPIRRVRVEDIVADDCHTFVRILSVTSPIEDIHIENVRGGCRVSAVNMDACRECRVPLFEPDDPQFADGAGSVARVYLRNFQVYKSAGGNGKPLLDLRTRIKDFRIADFERVMVRDANPTVPTLHLSDIQPNSQFVITGLHEEQLVAVQQASTSPQLDVHRQQSVGGASYLRCQGQLERAGRLVLPRGGFTLLDINPSTSR